MFRLATIAKTLPVKSTVTVFNKSVVSYFHSSARLFEEEKKTAEAPKTETPKTEAPKDAKPAEVNVADLQKKLTELDKANKDLKNQNLRLLAEMENVRNIARRDVNNDTILFYYTLLYNERSYALQKFGKSLLSVCDNMDLALKHVPKNEIEGDKPNASLVSLYQGLIMTQQELTKVLGSQGIVKFGVEGDAFNPNVHEAMFNIPYTEGAKENSIGQVITTGYMFKDRVMRPCKAGIIGKKQN
ncbi:hypothetical protein WA158_006583 [Blastocystis sp. Blastoise]